MKKEQFQVIKVGGAHLDNVHYLWALARHIASIKSEGRQVVLVHGGGKEIGELHRALDVPFRKELGLRVTSDEGINIVAQVLCGLINKRIVARLTASGLRAMGVSGADLGLLRSDFINQAQLGRVGCSPTVDTDSLRAMARITDVLVVAPVSLGPDDHLVNVNADTAAQAIAVALNATKLDFVTDVGAVRTDEGTVRSLSPQQVETLVRTSEVYGGMVPKLRSSVAALHGGVRQVRVGNLETLSAGTATVVHQ